MSERKEDTMQNYAKDFVNNIDDSGMLNKDDDSLPYGYLHPQTEGKLYWMCGQDQEGRITSVFKCDDENLLPSSGINEGIQYLKDIEEARHYRDELVKSGWIPMKNPGMRFFYGGREVEMTRKIKRQLAKKVKKMEKQMKV